MKKIIFLILLLFSTSIYAQTTGNTDTPYSTNGWTAPIDSTQYYKLNIFKLLTNPGGYLNINTRRIDSLFNALVVYTDSTQMIIDTDTLRLSNSMSGISSFADSTKNDTITIPGIDSSDVFVSTWIGTAPNSTLSVTLLNDKVVVHQTDSLSLSKSFNWIWIRKY